MRSILMLTLATLLVLAASGCSSKKDRDVLPDPFIGDWQGSWTAADGQQSELVAQVIALGKDEYRVHLLPGFDQRGDALAVLEGALEGRVVKLHSAGDEAQSNGTRWYGVIDREKFTGTIEGERAGMFELERVFRLSPSLGEKPPAGAEVLFDGRSLDGWRHPEELAGMVNLARLFGGDNVAAYLRSEIWSEKAQPAIMELGSDDGVKAWLNGTLVHAKNVGRGVSPGEDRVPVNLQQGWNVLMLKVTNGTGGWGAIVRLADNRGARLAGIAERGMGASQPAQMRDLLEKYDGYLTLWLAAGPYREESKDGAALFDVAFAPEKNDPQIDWQPVNLAERDYSPQWSLVDGAMEVKPGSGNLVTAQRFGDFQLHLEFRTPFMPEARGQARGNSGVYLQGRYEIQVLDSYGLEGKDNECGGVYQVAAPAVNMCAPPGQWQTYDITFHAPRFDSSGNKTTNARVTVIHNGVVIHENLAIPAPTGGALDHQAHEPGSLMLQDHGDLVQFRNIWLVAL